MRTVLRLLLSVAAGIFLLSPTSASQAQTAQDQTERAHTMARHFSERPPVQFEILHTADQQPRMVITNLHQYPLTAFIVRTDPTAANSITNTLVFDALTHMGLLAPIPRSLSFVTGVPHKVGESAPDPVLAAAVWEDGSTFGPDELLARLPKSRSALADGYDRAIAMLQTGLDKNWSAAQYSAAAQQLRLRSDPAQTAIPEAGVATATPIYTLTVNMDRATQNNRSARIVSSMARSLLTRFIEERDALRQSLIASTRSAEASSNQ
jgi:hypothetical protein